METKKSNRANLEKKRVMFFQVGLLLALGLAFVAFEWQVALRVSDVKWEPVPIGDVDEFVIQATFDKTPPPPPEPDPGDKLVPTDDGRYIVIGEDGTPRGEWVWDDVQEKWIFDEYPPLGGIPDTGVQRIPLYLPLLMVSSLVGVGAAIVGLRVQKRREKISGV